MRPPYATLILLATALLLPAVAAADGVLARGAALADACAACHGPDGRGRGAIPSIDRLSAEDFTAAMKAFRADTRKGTVMNHIAKGLDDVEIEAMASHYARLRQR